MPYYYSNGNYNRPYRPGTKQGTRLVWLLIFNMGFLFGGIMLIAFGFAFDEQPTEEDASQHPVWFPGTDPTYYVMRHAGIGCLIIGVCFTFVTCVYCGKEKEAICGAQ